MERRQFSTTSVEPGRRLAYWNDIAAASFGPIAVDAAGEGFHGELISLAAHRCQVTSVKSTAAIVSDAWRPARYSSDQAIFRLQLTHFGECRLTHCGHDEVLRAGDFTIMDISKPFGVAFKQPTHTLAIHLPAERFISNAHNIERAVGAHISGCSGAGAVLSTFLRSMWDNIGEGNLENWPRSASAVLWDLIEAVCSASEQSEDQGPRGLQHRLRAEAVVDQRLCDAELDISEIADALGVSERYVYLLFAQIGTTPARYILDRRLELAAEQLRRAGQACRVTDVAMDVGFNDLSHFSRVFRKRFGQSPSRYRSSFSGCPEAWL